MKKEDYVSELGKVESLGAAEFHTNPDNSLALVFHRSFSKGKITVICNYNTDFSEESLNVDKKILDDILKDLEKYRKVIEEQIKLHKIENDFL